MLSKIKGTGSGTAPVVNITFPYINKLHVKATVDGVPAGITWTGVSQVTFDAGVPADAEWVVYRDSSLTATLVDFTDTAVLTEADLDLNATQHLYLEQELADAVAEANSAASAAQEAADEALALGSSISSVPNATAHAATRVALALLSTGSPAYLTEEGVEGHFTFLTGNHAASVAADPAKGVFVAPAADPTGASGTWVRHLPDGKLYAHVFGMVEGDHADELGNSSNLKAINRAVRLASIAGITHVVIPTGTWYLNAVHKDRWVVDSGMDVEAAQRILIRPGANNHLTLEFEPGARLVRTANDGTDPLNSGAPYVGTDVSAATMVRVRIEGGETIRVIGPDTDGNEANFPYDGTAGHEFDYQQAHNLDFHFSTSVTDKAKLIEVRNCRIRGAVADGVSFNAGAEQLILDGVYADPRVRRYRSDIVFGVLPDRAFIDNIAVDAFEYEPVANNDDARHVWGPNIVARCVLDVLGQADVGHYLNVSGWMPTHLHEAGARSYLALAQLSGELNLKRITTGGTPVSGTIDALTRSKLVLRGGDAVIGGTDADATIAAPIQFWTDTDGQYVDFIGTRFSAAAGVVTGAYVSCNMSNSANRSVRLVNCDTDGALQYVADLNRPGTAVLDGGKLKATVAILKPTTGSTAEANFHLRNFSQWEAPALIDGSAGMGSTATTRFFVQGVFNGEYAAGQPGMVPITATSLQSLGLYPIWNVDATMTVTSTPAARIPGLPGLKARLKQPGSTSINEWHYANVAAALTNAQWKTVPRFLAGSKTQDWADLATATTQSTTVTVTGAALGDKVDVAMSVTLGGTRIWGEVTAADTVTVYQRNDTGANVNVASGTLSAIVTKVS